jgi:hypothetical protein
MKTKQNLYSSLGLVVIQSGLVVQFVMTATNTLEQRVAGTPRRSPAQPSPGTTTSQLGDNSSAPSAAGPPVVVKVHAQCGSKTFRGQLRFTSQALSTTKI